MDMAANEDMDRKARVNRLVKRAVKAAARARGEGVPEKAKVAAPSLLDALRERPVAPGGTPNWNGKTGAVVGQVGPHIYTAKIPKNRALTNPLVVVSDMWTPAEYRTYERLTAMVCSPVISERARAQVWLRKFVEKHGRAKCDMMMAEIRRRDEQEWFKDKSRTKGA